LRVVLSDRFADAFAYANSVHRNQGRKGTEIPYVSHLLAVASIVLEAGGDEDEAIAALLHDAPEDQGGHPQLEQIRVRFGDRVAAIVEGCSDSLTVEPWAKEDWRVRKERYHDHARRTADSSVLLVSASDKLHNARATLADLQRVGPGVWDRFTGGREGSLWNYETLRKLYADSDDPRVRQLAAELDPIVKGLEEH
jgi:(p)ppGpp synthase/HD superfamily hydrolase